MQVCSPDMHERGTSPALEGDSDKPYADEEEEETGLEHEDSEMMPGVAYAARIVNNRARTGSTPAEVALIVDRWEPRPPSRSPVLVLRSTSATSASPDVRTPLRRTTFRWPSSRWTWSRTPSSSRTRPEFAIPHVVVANAKWANAKLETSFGLPRSPTSFSGWEARPSTCGSPTRTFWKKGARPK